MLDGIFNDQPESPIVRAELHPISRKLPFPSTEEGSNWLPKNRYLQLNTLGLSVYIKQSDMKQVRHEKTTYQLFTIEVPVATPSHPTVLQLF